MRATLPRVVGALVAFAMALVMGQPPADPGRLAAQTAPNARVVVAAGHVDIGPRVIDGTWRIQVRDDTVQPAVWRDPADVVIQAVPASRLVVPSDPALSFVGNPGEEVWLLPQVERSGVAWPGWNTQDPSVGADGAGGVDWTLHRVTGPGGFVLFLTGSFGEPSVLFTSAKAGPQTVHIEPATHAHGNWAFTKPGVYLLEVEMSTRGQVRHSARATLAFAVGDASPETAFQAVTQQAKSAIAPAKDGMASATSNLALPVAVGAAVVIALLVGGALAARRFR
jgi:putative ABC transporter-associated repeat protein